MKYNVGDRILFLNDKKGFIVSRCKAYRNGKILLYYRVLETNKESISFPISLGTDTEEVMEDDIVGLYSEFSSAPKEKFKGEFDGWTMRGFE